jgi:hypothetical protein
MQTARPTTRVQKGAPPHPLRGILLPTDAPTIAQRAGLSNFPHSLLSSDHVRKARVAQTRQLFFVSFVPRILLAPDATTASMRALSRRDNPTIARRFNAGVKFIIAEVPKGRLNVARALVS